MSIPSLSSRDVRSNATDGAVRAAPFVTAASTFPTGVAVLTTWRDDDHPIGVTVASFTTVSLQPPLVLVCVHRRCRVLHHLLRQQRFAVNVLSARQELLSRQFSSNMADRFADVDWNRGLTGVPLLRGTLAAFECLLVRASPGGDHQIILGSVERLTSRPGVPLVRFGGAYRKLAPSPVP